MLKYASAAIMTARTHPQNFNYGILPGFLLYDLPVTKTRNLGETCAGPECDRPAKCKGLCISHDAQRRSGKPLKPLRARQKVVPDHCTFDGCDKSHHAQGLCVGHYYQKRRTGSVGPLLTVRTVCTFDGCERPHESHGLCNGHNIQRRDGRELTPLRRRESGRTCEVDGCSDLHWARGKCQTHYNIWHWAESPEGRKARQKAFHKRRAIRAEAETFVILTKEWRRMLHRYRGMCAYCGQNPWSHREHVIPLSRGGRESIGNLLPACSSCNLTKKGSLVMEWRHRR